MRPEPIDLDAQATSPLAPEALAAMLPFLERQHWNPHSAHRGGRVAKAALEAGRTEVAALLGGDPADLIFTSGATEANNLALKGVLQSAEPSRRRLVTFATEHACVLESARHLAADGYPVTILPVLPDGMPDMMAYRAALGPDVALVSAMAINNEIGSIWPVAEIARAADAAGALMHCDAAQAYGKIDCDLMGPLRGCNLVSLSAHKMHGPKGIGALWLHPQAVLSVQIDGGGQENDIRSGTQSPALAAGFGASARLARSEMAARHTHAERLMRIVLEALQAVPHRIHGPRPLGPDRWPGNLSVQFPGVDSGRLLSALPGLALSSGSACSSGAGRPSHVLAAIGVPRDAIAQSIRLGWGPYLGEADLMDAMAQLLTAVSRLARQAA